MGLAEFYGEHLTDQRLRLYAMALEDTPLETIERVAKEIMRDPKVTRFPLPAVILERIRPASNPEHDALEAASRIVEAISKFGYCNPSAAEKFIGPLGWQVVRGEGGWEALCEKVTTDKIPMYRAQWREHAKAIHGRTLRGEFSGPGLPKPIEQSREAMPTHISGLLSGRDKAAGKDE